jgi:hypothetical protein
LTPSPRRRSIVPVLAAFLAALAACATTAPSRFYTLTPMKATDGAAPAVPFYEGTLLAVGPVRLPDYLDRPQIITRQEGNEVRLHETERWAGSLQEDISRVLVENLSGLLAGKRIAVVRWTSAMQTMAPFRNRLAVEILRFEGPAGGTVVLKARYALLRPDGNHVIATGESIVQEPAGGADYGSLVAAMSRALAAFSREIAAAIPAR